MTDTPLHEDLLDGAEEIATFMFGASDRKSVRRVYHAAARNQIPHFRRGKRLCSRRSAIMKSIERAEAASLKAS